MYDAGTPSKDMQNMLTAAFTGDDIFHRSNMAYTTEHKYDLKTL